MNQDKNTMIMPTVDDVIYVSSDTPEDSDSILHIDKGVLYGLGFFETIHVLQKAAFLDAHLERLNKSLNLFQIPFFISKELVLNLIDKYNIKNQSLKLLVSEQNIIATTRPIPYHDKHYETGVQLSLSNIIRSSKSFLVNHKSCNYGDLYMSLLQAKDNGFDDCLFFNEHDSITETSNANIFIIKDNHILTPPVEDGILPGIVRKHLIDTYSISKQSLTIKDLITADAVFLTNSIVGIIKVSSIYLDPHILEQNRHHPLDLAHSEKQTYHTHPLIKQLSDDYFLYLHKYFDKENI